MKLLYLLIFTCLAAQPGKLIELNGYRLHYIESGSGKPVIVFFHGAGDIALMWKPVINQLSDEFHSVAIDEHGNGWSEFGQINHSLRQQAFDSKQLLSKAKLNGPYILIGHSRGALVALEFFRQFKNNVIGIVLVDPSHPDMMLRYRQSDGSFKWQKVMDRAKSDSVPDIINTVIQSDREMKSFPLKREIENSYNNYSATDMNYFQHAYNRQVKIPANLHSFFSNELKWMSEHRADYFMADRPLLIISAGQREKQGDNQYSADELIAHSNQLRNDYLNFSRKSRLIIAKNSGHDIPQSEPQLIADQIRNLIEQIK